MDSRNPVYTKIVLFVAAIAVIFALTIYSFQEVVNNDFQRIDTQIFVLDNPHIRSFSGENIRWMITEIELDHWHPLTWFSYAMDYRLYGGLDPSGFHLTNTLLHSINAVWLFLFVIVLLGVSRSTTATTPTRPPPLVPWRIDNDILFAATTAAVLFGIHVQHVESVAWVAERKDVLSLFFLLPTLIAYLYYAGNAAAGVHKPLLYSFSLCGFLLALASKVMMMTIPVVLILLDVYPLRRLRWNKSSVYKVVFIEKLPFFALSILASILTVAGVSHSVVELDQLGIHARVLNSFNNIVLYLSKTLLPTGFSFYYSFPDYDTALDYVKAGASIAAVLLITLLCVDQWRRDRRYWLVAWLIYLVTLSPVVGMVQSGAQAAADRYTYLSTIPIYVLSGTGIAWMFCSRHKLLKSGGLFLFLGIVVALVTLTRQQTLYWKDSLTLWRHAALYSPNQPIAHYNLGIDYLHARQYGQALKAFSRARDLSFGGDAYYGMGLAYTYLGKFEQALQQYNYIIDNGMETIDGRDDVYAGMALVFYEQERYIDADKMLQKAAEINPENRLLGRLKTLLKNTKTRDEVLR